MSLYEVYLLCRSQKLKLLRFCTIIINSPLLVAEEAANKDIGLPLSA
jgi:hypothetical protein